MRRGISSFYEGGNRLFFVVITEPIIWITIVLMSIIISLSFIFPNAQFFYPIFNKEINYVDTYPFRNSFDDLTIAISAPDRIIPSNKDVYKFRIDIKNTSKVSKKVELILDENDPFLTLMDPESNKAINTLPIKIDWIIQPGNTLKVADYLLEVLPNNEPIEQVNIELSVESTKRFVYKERIQSQLLLGAISLATCSNFAIYCFDSDMGIQKSSRMNLMTMNEEHIALDGVLIDMADFGLNEE